MTAKVKIGDLYNELRFCRGVNTIAYTKLFSTPRDTCGFLLALLRAHIVDAVTIEIDTYFEAMEEQLADEEDLIALDRIFTTLYKND